MSRPAARGLATPGWPTALLAVATLLAAGGLIALLLVLARNLAGGEPTAAQVYGGAGGFGAYALLGLVVWLRTRRIKPGTRGRARARTLALGAILFGACCAAAFAAFPKFLEASLPLESFAERVQSMHMWPQRITIGTLAAIALSGVVALGADLSCWFLLREKLRRRAWWSLDVLLLLLAGLTWYRWYAQGGQEVLPQQAQRFAANTAVGLRLAIRLIPVLLDRIESISFRSLVAARLLRAKKSGFLAAISGLSILAVTVATVALVVTLSVMGGFRQDLKRKILGNNAHIVVDKAEGHIDGYKPLVDEIRNLDDVRGVSPFVSGEVMISSASNLAGAILRGVDPAHVGEVSELPRTMQVPKWTEGADTLDYLKHPQKLLSLPPDQMYPGTDAPPRVKVVEREQDAEPGPKQGGLLDDMQWLDEGAPDPGAADDTLDDEGALDEEDALPGIIVGRELARSLRLYLGDEVNVVSPLGDLGPTGPIPKARPFRVAGIFYSGMYEYDMKYVYVTLPVGQRFLSTGSAISGIEITVDEPEQAARTAKTVEATLDRQGLRVRPWQELNENLFGALALEKLGMSLLLGIAVVVASFCIIGTLILMVQEKGREVAVLKALGTSSGAIARIFIIKGALIGLFGAVLGLGLGYVACFAAERFGVRLNPEVYYIDRLPVHIDFGEFAAVGIATVVVCVLATVYPAVLAAGVRPVEALRYE